MFARTKYVAVVAAALVIGMITSGASAQLLNPSFESPDASAGDVPGTDDWGTFNDVFTTAGLARTGNQSLKTFGPFTPGGGTGATQTLPASEGQTWTGEIYALSESTDPLEPDDFGVYKIEFLDAGLGPVGGSFIAGVNVFDSNIFDAALPQDEWTLLGVGTAPAPAGTAFANAVLVKVDVDGTGGGSIFWDDASLVVPEPSCLALCGMAVLALLFRRR